MAPRPWFYRLLLFAFPQAFRARFGDDMAEAFADRRRAARARGRAAVIALWWHTATDMLAHGLAERRSTARLAHAATMRGSMGQSIIRDLQYGLRTFRKRPVASAAAVLILAVGIGATTAVFSVNDALIWRPLPYPDADRLVLVEERNDPLGFAGNVAIENFDEWQGRVPSVEAAAAWAISDVNLAGADEAARVRGAVITPGLFDLNGARQVLGRAIQAADREMGRHLVAVLSEGAWRRLFGGAPDVIGRSVLLDSVPHVVVGVVTGVAGFADVDVWRPLTRSRDGGGRREHAFRAVARLAPGVPIERAASEIDGVYAALEVAHPETNRGWRARLTPLKEVMIEDLTTMVRLSGAVVAVLLLIACANVANLLLARASERQREFAVRRALGAERARLLRQVLTESLLLAGAGALAGLGVAWAVTKALVAVLAAETTLWLTPGLDARMLGFATGVAVATAVIFGVLPALVMSRVEPQVAMRQGVASSASPARRRLGTALTFAQMTLACLLLIAAGLLLNSLQHALRVDPGFDGEGVITFRVTPARSAYADATSLERFYDTLLTELRRLPQVAHAGAVSGLPLAGNSIVRGVIRPDEPIPALDAVRLTLHQAATPGYVSAVGIRLRAGRDFTSADSTTAAPVAIVNRSLADALWPAADPIGREILVHTDEQTPRRVVGVTDDVRHVGLDAPVYPQYFVPFAQSPARSMSVTVRSTAPVPAGDLRRVVAGLDPSLPLYEMQTLDALLDDAIGTRRALTLGLTAFGLVALVLAVTGLAATVGTAVTERRREIGIRLALGATPRGIASLFLRQGAAVAGLGVVAGLGLSRLTAPFLEELLFGVTPLDAPSVASAVVTLLAAAMAATWAAARPATRVDPLETLRTD